jgi:hypothetical protein
LTFYISISILGGQGVVVNLDYVTQLLKGKGYKGLLKGVADAGWLQNLSPWSGDSGAVSMQQQMSEGHSIWGGLPTNEACLKGNSGAFQYLCYLSPFALPYLHSGTPIFIQAEQFDTFQGKSSTIKI